MGNDETRRKIMDATFEALKKHGYADLSIKKIADEFEKGKSLIYYHFDDKEDLMLNFLDHIQDQIRSGLESESSEPEEKLECFLRTGLGLDEEMREFRIALLEMKARAPYSAEFREKFREIDDELSGFLRQILEEMGIEDPEEESQVVLSTIEGAANRGIVAERTGELEEARKWIKGYLEER
ncbi:MAG: TetR/AcrR family transcriptional regulator [Candidatus Nanohaloarchaea archaeon]